MTTLPSSNDRRNLYHRISPDELSALARMRPRQARVWFDALSCADAASGRLREPMRTPDLGCAQPSARGWHMLEKHDLARYERIDNRNRARLMCREKADNLPWLHQRNLVAVDHLPVQCLIVLACARGGLDAATVTGWPQERCARILGLLIEHGWHDPAPSKAISARTSRPVFGRPIATSNRSITMRQLDITGPLQRTRSIRALAIMGNAVSVRVRKSKAADRRKRMAAYLMVAGARSDDALAARYKVSISTIRRDRKALGVLKRRGGLRVVDGGLD